MEQRMKEIADRKLEIRSLLQSDEVVDLEKVQSELDALESEEKELRNKQEIAEKINIGEVRGKVMDKPVVEVKEKDTEMEYRKAFMEYVLRGKEIPMELRTDASTTVSDLGAGIPTTLLDRIVDKLEATGMILSRVTRTNYKGGLSIAVSSLKPTASWVNEGAGSELKEKTTAAVTFTYFKLRCAVSVSLEVNEMAISAFEAAIVANISEAMVKALEQAIISGAGTASPKGILAETPVSGQAIDGTPVYASIMAAEAALPQAYENDAVWVMSKGTFYQLMAQTASDGQPIARVNQGLDGKPVRALMGREVVLCPYVDTYATGMTDETVFAFLFNLKDYVLNTNYNVALKKYEDNTTDDVVTKAIMLVDGKVIDKNSLVTLKK